MEKNFYKFISEDIKTVNYSDIETWKEPKDRSYATGTKNIDIKLGSKVLEMLEEHGLTVTSYDKGDFLRSHKILIADEPSFIEYRVRLGKLIYWDDFLENNGYTVEEFDKLSKKEKKSLEDNYADERIDDDGEMEFSVFLPLTIKTNIIEAALSDASNYLKILHKTYPDVIKGYVENSFLSDTTETINFINAHKIKITNKNLDDVATISYRLYKDSKFFGAVSNIFDDNFCKDLFDDWLKLL